MKKYLILIMAATAMFVSCQNGTKQKALISQNDSLQAVIAERDAALNEMISTINAVEEGFRAINEAQGRINLNSATSEVSR